MDNNPVNKIVPKVHPCTPYFAAANALHNSCAPLFAKQNALTLSTPKYGHIKQAYFFIALLILVSWFHKAHAANLPDQINFQHILENKDIGLGSVRVIFQDSEGFMWFGGSTALLRYDGYDFRQFHARSNSTKPSQPTAVTATLTIFEDSHHTLWIGAANGLFKFDPSTETLIELQSDDAQAVDANGYIMSICELPTGEIIASSDENTFSINPQSLKYTPLKFEAENKSDARPMQIVSAYLSPEGELWQGTTLGLKKIDLATNTYKLYKPYSDKPGLIPENSVNDIVADNEGTLWVATKNGLVHFDPKTQNSIRYVNDPNNPFSLGGNDIWKLLLDSQGVLWAATDGGGLSIFDKKTKHFINHRYSEGRASSINSNQVRTVFEDKNGDIWVGNYPEGINFFDRSSASIITYTKEASNPNSLSQSTALSVQEDPTGNLWIGTDGGGLNYLNRATGKFTLFKSDPNDPTTISSNAILTVFIDSYGLIWVGTWGGGMSSYNPADKTFTRYPFESQPQPTERVRHSLKLNSPHVWSIREDKNHDLWICTHTGGVSKYNRTSKLFTHYSHIDHDPKSISNNLVWNTFEDSAGRLWLGTVSGLNILNPENGTVTRYAHDSKYATSLSHSSAVVSFEDSKKRLWFGTDQGLNLYHPSTDNFTVFDKKDGLFNDVIRNILEDSEGTLWLSTDNGFSSFNPDTKKIKNYSHISGRLIGGFPSRSGIASQHGEIIFGGFNGLRIFNPKELTQNNSIPPVVLTDLKIFSDSVVIGGADNILKKSIGHTESITLDYKDSLFVLDFAALNFRDSTKNKHAYKLEGFDKTWQDAGSQRTAKYTNLSAGTYIFHVKGSNNDGLWNTTGKSITIIQLPPPWKSWQAYTAYTLIIASLIAVFIYSQRKKRQLIEAQNRLLEIKVAERTAELREKNTDIQSMLGNMRQGLFTIVSGGAIHHEYSGFLEEIFETKNIYNQNAIDFLFGSADLDANTTDQVESAINSIIGEHEISFDVNSHLLTEEYAVQINQKTKFLSLDWRPILVDQTTTKLMVSVRDISLLKKMELEASNKKRELDIVSQLLNVPPKKYLSFAASAKHFIEENRIQINTNEQPSDGVIALLFRNMHTLKGNCRTFNFDHFSNVVHEVESTYGAIKIRHDYFWDRKSLLNDLLLVEEILHEYEHVFATVLGRRETRTGGDAHGFWADRKAIDIIQQYIDTTHPKPPSPTQPLLPIQRLLNTALSTPLNEVLSDIIDSLPSMALQINKEPPSVIIDENRVRIKFNATELVINVFTHILRNSIDHGIEATALRLKSGKARAGSITIRATPQQQSLQIHIKDDGQGINIGRLFNKGIEHGHWQPEDQPSLHEIANLIFASGISTKEAVTALSGRGVGMNAVKEFLLAQGGNITLRLLGNDVNFGEGAMVAFELIVELPENAFMLME